MGVVYEAEDPHLGRQVALKLLPPDMAGDAERLERFEREAKAVAALNHPSIVTIHSVERSHGVPFFTMELVEGRTLGELIPAAGMPLETFLDLAVRLADALRAAHEKGLTHRDLKPANIMVTEEGRPKILDFGLVKLPADNSSAGAPEEETTRVTREGLILGTLPYMSPEQAQGRNVDPRSDVFSLGVILYEMITGKRPFGGETRASLVAAILKDAPRPVSDLRTDLPATLEELILSCLEKEPEQRSASAREVHDELDRLRHRIEAERLIADSGTAPRSGAHRRPILLLAGAGTVLAILLGVVLWQIERSPERAREIARELEDETPGYLRPVSMAEIQALLGDADEAVRLLRQAYRDRSPDFATLRAEPLFDPLRDDPRFQELLEHLRP